MKPPTTGEDTTAPTPVKPEASSSGGTGSGMSATTTMVASTSTQTQTQPTQQTTGGSSSASSMAFGTVKYRIKPPSAANTMSSTATGSNSAGCFIKPSLSLNSLPPQAPPEGSEMAQNRLRIDRPYNSLKKKRDSERELWRRSWGSGHSHSSCSLQSSITTGIGKDDFWAALQTNYNFIMDTNLLDSCREARGEIEGPVVHAKEDHMDYYRRAMYKPSPMQTFYGDPRLLRQWIREMEIRISRIPSITETKKLNTEQLLRLSGEHSEIYREIESNSRAVAACVRAYEKKAAKASRFSGNISGVTSVGSSILNTTASELGGPPSGSGSLTPEVDAQPGTSVAYYSHKLSNKSKESSVIKGLERRYYLLYLKAYEIRCLLEGLLDTKTSSSDNNASLSDTDEEPVNKQARLSSSVKSKSSGSLQNECLSGEEWVKGKKLSNAGFDADSEGSDCEIVPKIITYHLNSATTTATTNTPSTPPPSAAALLLASQVNPRMEAADIQNLSTNTITNGNGSAANSPATTTLTIGKLSGEDIIDGILRGATAQDLINNNENSSSSNNENSNPLLKKSPKSPKQNGKQKRSKTSEAKFNRSTRKSKNCATFYFKHLDTDSELNKDSSERTKSEESTSSSEGDEWVYNNGGDDGQGGQDSSSSGGDQSKSAAQVIPLGDDEDEKENKPGEGRKDHHSMAIGKEVKSKRSLDFTQESLVGGVTLSTRPLMMTSIGSFGKSTDSVDSNGKSGSLLSAKHQQQYATSPTIQRLVLHAETLVRDEIFAKTPKTVVKNPHYLHHYHQHHHHHGSAASGSSSNSHHQLYHHKQQLQQHQQQPYHHLSSTTSSSRHHHQGTVNGGGGSGGVGGIGSNSSRKAEKVMSNLKINRIEEWLEKQPLDVAATAPLLPGSAPTTDCEASGEYTDSDSIARDTDSSEGLANSVATCLQGDQTSQEMLLTDNVYPSETSNVSNDEVESKNNSNSNPSLVKRRVNKSTAERPWSVSCISQLNTSAVEINQYGERRETHSNQRLTASFSISESALNTMSPVRPGALKQTTSSGNGSQLVVKSSDSKGSLKKRKLRARRKNRIDESGSDESQPAQQSSTLHLLQHSLILQHQQQLLQQQQPLREIQLSAGSSSGSGGRHQHHQHQSSSHRGGGGGGLLKSESFSGRIRLSDDLVTMSSLSGSSGSRKSSSARQTTRSTAMTTMMATGAVVSTATKKSAPDSEEEHLQQQALMAKPNFKIGSVTRARCGSLNLGSLAALANYNLDGVERTEADLNGTGTGTEEMSSFSEQAWDNYQEKYMSEPYSEDRDTDAARRLLDFGDDYRNFIDSQSDCASSSLSAANMDSMSPPRFRKNDSLGKSSEPNTNSLNRRKRLDEYRMDDRYSHNMNSWSSKSGSPPHHSLDKTLTSSRGKHHVLYESPDHSPSGSSGGAPTGAGPLGGSGRRRSLRSVDKHNSFLRSLSHETSSSSNNEFDEDMEAEMKKLLIQSKLRLANTEALKAKSHLLKPEDYDEIIKTCRENVRCLETVLLSQPGTVLTAAKCQDLRGKRKPSTTKRGTHHRLKKPGGGTGNRTLLNRKNRRVYNFDEDQDQQIDGSEGEIDEEGHGHDPPENENSDDQNFSDNDSGVRVDDMDGQRNTVVVYECRCAKITRFVATLIEYLLDVGNLIRNFNMYRFFVGVLHGFYRLVGFFGRKPSGGDGDGDGGNGGDGPLRALSVGIV